MKLEVVCTTMFQKNLSKFSEMNIQTDVVFANQDDRHEYIEENIAGNTVKMITTPYRGVGENRNMALLHSSKDILLFSDDDMVYKDGYEETILRAFTQLPQADIIIFNIGSIGKECIDRRINKKINKINILNVLNYGMPRIAIRKKSLSTANIWVSTLFGGGAKYCGGEDNLFLVTALKNKLNIYTYPEYIGDVRTGNSTWFEGFNEKYFYDNGAWLQATFPMLKYILLWYFIARFSKKSSLSVRQIYRLHIEGIKGFKKSLTYKEWAEQNL